MFLPVGIEVEPGLASVGVRIVDFLQSRTVKNSFLLFLS